MELRGGGGVEKRVEAVLSTEFEAFENDEDEERLSCFGAMER